MNDQPQQSSENFSSAELEAAEKFFSRQVEFYASAATIEALPAEQCAEVALIGRSNVGKSSLINALCRQNSLARTSRTPGRTQALNFFRIPELGTIVDMPGYGYANVSKQKSYEWGVLSLRYLSDRKALRRTFVLIDSRHGITATDDAFLKQLDRKAVSYQLVFTKTDHLNSEALNAAERQWGQNLQNRTAAYPYCLWTSALLRDSLTTFRATIYRVLSA